MRETDVGGSPIEGSSHGSETDGQPSTTDGRRLTEGSSPVAPVRVLTSPAATAGSGPDATAPGATAPGATAPIATAPDATAPNVTAPDAAAADGAGRRRAERSAPHWFELITLACIVTLATVGSAGLLLAIVGRYSTLAALVIGLPLAVLGVFALHRGLPAGSTSRAAQFGAGAAVLIAIGYAVFAGVTPAQYMVVDRDPGSYMTTAVQLSDQGSLEVDARGQAFDGVRGLRFSGAAVYDTGGAYPPTSVPGEPGEVRQSGLIEPQFNHLTSVALAVAFDVGGNRLMFRLPALIAGLGLLALYAVTVRTTRRPLISLLAPALMAVGMPLLAVARATYSETFTMALLWGGVLVLLGLHFKPRVSVAAVGGVLLGALVCTRIDALMYVGMLFPLAAVSIATGGTPGMRAARIRAWLVAVAATAAVGAIGWWDLSQRTGYYAENLSPQLRLLRAALIASAVISVLALVVWSFVPAVRTIVTRVSRPVAAIVAAVVGVALLFGWWVRPLVQTATQAQQLPAVRTIQTAEGLPLEPFRTYAEDSLQWMAWYIGAPALLLAIGALCWGTWKVLRGRGQPALVTLLALCLGAGALYWYDPQITPDQIWASRRYVPAILPALAVWATVAVAVCASVPRFRQLSAGWRYTAAGVVAVALILPPALTTAPVMWQRPQGGYLKPILQTCDELPDDAAVIVVGGFAGVTLSQTLRTWCDVPVAAEGSALGADKVADVAAQVRANGYELFLVGAAQSDVAGYQVPGGPVVQSTDAVDNPWTAEATLDRPPSSYRPPNKVLPVPTPFALHVLQVPAP